MFFPQKKAKLLTPTPPFEKYRIYEYANRFHFKSLTPADTRKRLKDSTSHLCKLYTDSQWDPN